MAFTGGTTPSGGGLGAMAGVVMVFIGLIVVTAIMQFAPTIGGQIEKAQPTTNSKEICWVCSNAICTRAYAECTGDVRENVSVWSDWNATYHTDLPSAPDSYAANTTMGTLLILVIIVSLILAYLIRI